MYFECILVSIKKYPNIRSILFNWMFSIHVLFSPSNPGAYSEKNIKIQIISIFSQFHLMSPDDIFLIKIYKLIYNLSSRYLITINLKLFSGMGPWSKLCPMLVFRPRRNAFSHITDRIWRHVYRRWRHWCTYSFRESSSLVAEIIQADGGHENK